VTRSSGIEPAVPVGDLPALRVAPRVQAVQRALDAAGCDALLVTDDVNRRWLTGFSGSAGLVLVTRTDAWLVTDGRYAEQAGAEVTAASAPVEVLVERSVDAQRRAVSARAAGLARVGLEAATVPWAQVRDYDAHWFPDAELVPTDDVVETHRRVKDVAELARIEAAAGVADRALAAVRPLLGQGPTELEVAFELEAAMRRLGAEGPSFDTIVAAGPNASRPHARPTSRRLQPGDTVVVDMGAVIDGYCSDMTRTFVLGEPDATQQRLLDVVGRAQRRGVETVADGVPAADVDAACRALIEEAGLGEHFVHGTGHGVGLRIHEDPRLGSTSADVLAAGNVVTVEPGVYLPGVAGVRIEDLVVVGEGGARALSASPYDPVVA
jgi:Xaa-Pro aminopeptidase